MSERGELVRSFPGGNIAFSLLLFIPAVDNIYYLVTTMTKNIQRHYKMEAYLLMISFNSEADQLLVER